MVEPLNTKASGHDPKLIAALQSLKKKLEAMPEPLRGPFLVEGLAPYVSSPALPAVDGGEIVEKLQSLSYELLHALGAYDEEAVMCNQAAALISSQKQQLETLTEDRQHWFQTAHDQLSALEAAESRVQSLEEALREIRELNLSSEDENGHRWANSDMINQTIVLALAGEKP